MTTLYAACDLESLCVSAHSGEDRVKRSGAARQRNAIFDERALADLCEAARVYSALVRRVAHSIRPEGTAAAGAQLRAHVAATADRLRECMFAQLCGAEQRCALKCCGHRARARVALVSGFDLAEVGVATL